MCTLARDVTVQLDTGEHKDRVNFSRKPFIYLSNTHRLVGSTRAPFKSTQVGEAEEVEELIREARAMNRVLLLLLPINVSL